MARLILFVILAGLAGSVQAMEDAPLADLEETLKQRVVRSPQDASAWRLLGQYRLQEGDWSGALGALHAALELDRLNVSAYYGVGQAAAELDRPDEARRWPCSRACLRHQPSSPRPIRSARSTAPILIR
jgi:uncharacterized protein HemY